MFGKKVLVVPGILFVLVSCASVDYETGGPTQFELREAESEIEQLDELVRNGYSAEGNLARLQRVAARMAPHAVNLCRALDEVRNCSFNVAHRDTVDFNAYATIEEDSAKFVYVTMGALEYTHTDDEIAFILAHEYGHLIGNHAREASRRTLLRRIGEWLGLLEDGDVQDRKQELEADLFATRLLLTAGYDIEGAYQVLMKLAALTDSSRHFPQTHPSGLFRLAAAKRYLQDETFRRITSKEQAWYRRSGSAGQRDEA